MLVFDARGYLAWSPVVGSVLRAVALAGCWVALTFGLGATILTRAVRDARAIAPAASVDDLSWQTPTPVTGVVAARRPVVTAKKLMTMLRARNSQH